MSVCSNFLKIWKGKFQKNVKFCSSKKPVMPICVEESMDMARIPKEMIIFRAFFLLFYSISIRNYMSGGTRFHISYPRVLKWIMDWSKQKWRSGHVFYVVAKTAKWWIPSKMCNFWCWKWTILRWFLFIQIMFYMFLEISACF